MVTLLKAVIEVMEEGEKQVPRDPIPNALGVIAYFRTPNDRITLGKYILFIFQNYPLSMRVQQDIFPSPFDVTYQRAPSGPLVNKITR